MNLIDAIDNFNDIVRINRLILGVESSRELIRSLLSNRLRIDVD